MKSKVYFSKNIKPETISQLYKLLGKELPGKIAFKLHSGEKGNQNFITPDFFAPFSAPWYMLHSFPFFLFFVAVTVICVVIKIVIHKRGD